MKVRSKVKGVVHGRMGTSMSVSIETTRGKVRECTLGHMEVSMTESG